MRKYGVSFKKVCGLSDSEIEGAVRDLLKEFEALELSPADWREVYLEFLKKLPELNERYKVLAAIYRAVSLRSDYILAGRVVGKVLKNFNILFQRLLGEPAFFIPTPEGMWLFEHLIEPGEREEAHREAMTQSTIVQQLSLLAYFEKFPRGVRA